MAFYIQVKTTSMSGLCFCFYTQPGHYIENINLSPVGGDILLEINLLSEYSFRIC